MARPNSSEDQVSTRERPSYPVVSFPQFLKEPPSPKQVEERWIDPPHSSVVAAALQKPTSVAAIERWMCRRLLQTIDSQPMTIVLWNGEEISAGDRPAAVRLAIRDRPTLYKLLLNPQWEFGEAYSQRRLEIEGGLRELLDLFYRARQKNGGSRSIFLRAIERLRRWRHSNSIARRRRTSMIIMTSATIFIGFGSMSRWSIVAPTSLSLR